MEWYKRDKIKRLCMINKYSCGGISFKDVKTKIIALKTTWYTTSAKSKLIPHPILIFFGKELLSQNESNSLPKQWRILWKTHDSSNRKKYDCSFQ